MSRRVVLTVVAAVVLAVAAALVWLNAGHRPQEPEARPALSTVKVAKTDLTDQQELPGLVSFGAGPAIKGTKEGVVTWLPAVGTVVNRGEDLYKVNNQPVTLFIGDTPLYRAIDRPGLSGPDVKVLKENLQELGFLGNDGRPDVTTAATMKAVSIWQKANGVEPTGKISLGDFLVRPAGARVASVKVSLGDTGVGEILETSVATPQVKVALGTGSVPPQKGASVVILDAAGAKRAGKIADIANAAPDTDAAAGAPQRAAAGQPPPKEAIVAFDAPDGLPYAEGTAVRVAVTTVDIKGVLTVPVVSLNALLEGGYAVRVPDPAARADSPGYKLVPVKVGTIVKGIAEISGGITEGTDVVTAS